MYTGSIMPVVDGLSVENARKELEALGIKVGPWCDDCLEFHGCVLHEDEMKKLDPLWENRFIWELEDSDDPNRSECVMYGTGPLFRDTAIKLHADRVGCTPEEAEQRIREHMTVLEMSPDPGNRPKPAYEDA